MPAVNIKTPINQPNTNTMARIFKAVFINDLFVIMYDKAYAMLSFYF